MAAAATKTETTAESKTTETKPGTVTPPTKTAEEIAAEQKTADDAAAAAQTKADEDAAAKKTADAATAAGKKTDDAAAAGAPEKYTLKLPEGGRVNDADLKSVEEIARAQGWTNDEAQAQLEQYAAQTEAMSKRFEEQTAADPTYGGEKLEQTAKLATAALNRFRPAGTPRGDALRELLNRTGYGNNLEWVSLMADIGKAMGEDSPQPGNRSTTHASTGSSTEAIADKLYPDKK